MQNKNEVPESFPQCKGTLYVIDEATSMYRPMYHVLQNERLLCFAGRYHRKVVYSIEVRFALFEKMKKLSSAKLKRGFILRTGERTYKFYLSSRSELEMWFENLKQYCYLADFDKQYETVTAIDSGKAATRVTLAVLGFRLLIYSRLGKSHS